MLDRDPVPDRGSLEADGYEIHEGLLSEGQFRDLRTILPSGAGKSVNQCNLLQRHGLLSRLVQSDLFVDLIYARTGKIMFPIRAILFDKILEANWHHEDERAIRPGAV